MILTNADLKQAIAEGNLVITSDVAVSPDLKIGVNTIDLHLGPVIGTYSEYVLDCKKELELDYTLIPDEGLLLTPGIIYLAKTSEHTYIKKHVPQIEGLSSIGRLGMDVHKTAGIGSIGFNNRWTLEITVTQPVRVYRYMPIAQLMLVEPKSVPKDTYNGNYQGSSLYPEPSMIHKKLNQ